MQVSVYQAKERQQRHRTKQIHSFLNITDHGKCLLQTSVDPHPVLLQTLLVLLSVSKH